MSDYNGRHNPFLCGSEFGETICPGCRTKRDAVTRRPGPQPWNRDCAPSFRIAMDRVHGRRPWPSKRPRWRRRLVRLILRVVRRELQKELAPIVEMLVEVRAP